MNKAWFDTGKWAVGFGLVGAIAGMLLSDSQADSAIQWGTVAQMGFLAAAAGAGGFVAALVKRKG